MRKKRAPTVCGKAVRRTSRPKGLQKPSKARLRKILTIIITKVLITNLTCTRARTNFPRPPSIVSLRHHSRLSPALQAKNTLTPKNHTQEEQFLAAAWGQGGQNSTCCNAHFPKRTSIERVLTPTKNQICGSMRLILKLGIQKATG